LFLERQWWRVFFGLSPVLMKIDKLLDCFLRQETQGTRFFPIHPSSLGHPTVLMEFIQKPLDGELFLLSPEERIEHRISEPFQDMEAVERGVE
jgi:hypothetical protein